MIFFFDTETTGFVNERLPDGHPDQPHIVQIAGILTDDAGKVANQFSLVVNPGVTIPLKTVEFHGITDDIAGRLGVSLSTAVGMFDFMARRADLIVAHNIKFDIGVMASAYIREARDIPQINRFCTMDAAAPVVNLPPTERMIAAGMMKPKSPKLEECVRYFFDEPLDGAHDALVDVAACSRVFFRLIDDGHFSLPKKEVVA